MADPFKMPITLHRRFLSRWVAGGAAALALAVLAGCASSPPAPPQDTVRQLATQRWQALLAKDFKRAYDMTAPSFRKLQTPEVYTVRKSAVPVRWFSARVLRVECESDDRCVARVEIESRPIAPNAPKIPLVGAVSETWVREDGRWWIFEAL